MLVNVYSILMPQILRLNTVREVLLFSFYRQEFYRNRHRKVQFCAQDHTASKRWLEFKSSFV